MQSGGWGGVGGIGQTYRLCGGVVSSSRSKSVYIHVSCCLFIHDTETILPYTYIYVCFASANTGLTISTACLMSSIIP